VRRRQQSRLAAMNLEPNRIESNADPMAAFAAMASMRFGATGQEKEQAGAGSKAADGLRADAGANAVDSSSTAGSSSCGPWSFGAGLHTCGEGSDGRASGGLASGGIDGLASGIAGRKLMPPAAAGLSQSPPPLGPPPLGRPSPPDAPSASAQEDAPSASAQEDAPSASRSHDEEARGVDAAPDPAAAPHPVRPPSAPLPSTPAATAQHALEARPDALPPPRTHNVTAHESPNASPPIVFADGGGLGSRSSRQGSAVAKKGSDRARSAAASLRSQRAPLPIPLPAQASPGQPRGRPSTAHSSPQPWNGFRPSRSAGSLRPSAARSLSAGTHRFPAMASSPLAITASSASGLASGLLRPNSRMATPDVAARVAPSAHPSPPSAAPPPAAASLSIGPQSTRAPKHLQSSVSSIGCLASSAVSSVSSEWNAQSFVRVDDILSSRAARHSFQDMLALAQRFCATHPAGGRKATGLLVEGGSASSHGALSSHDGPRSLPALSEATSSGALGASEVWRQIYEQQHLG